MNTKPALSARSIPAYAGEPEPLSNLFGGPTVYPRVCGGTAFNVAVDAHSLGLSPRMRGNLVIITNQLHLSGSIPAYAGEPCRVLPGATMRTVYPRVCGGTQLGVRDNDGAAGLSPRMRGNPPLAAGRLARRRSIPAYAGEP